MEPVSFDKWKYSLYSAIVFLILSLPQVYKYTSLLFNTTNKKGCPNFMGILLHSFVFLLIVRGMMNIKNI